LIVATITVLLAALSMLGNAAAQKDSVPKPQDKLALAENDVKHLLPLMEADRHGKVSRQEYMKFMAAEFDRLDKAKSGELDVKALTQSNLSVSRFVGK
jgi:Ca2+-binding EF-hand superfamily protein